MSRSIGLKNGLGQFSSYTVARIDDNQYFANLAEVEALPLEKKSFEVTYITLDTNIRYRYEPNTDSFIEVLNPNGIVFSVNGGNQINITGSLQNPVVNVITTPTFTNVSSNTPTLSEHLTTKSYVDTNISNLDTRISQNETTISALQLTDSNIITELSSLDGRLITAETDINTLETDLSTLNTRVNANETAITALQLTDAGFATDILNLEARLSQNETDISTIDGRLITAETDINTLETDISTLNTRVNANETAITALQLTDSGFATDILNLDARVSQNETDIVTNFSDIANLTNRVSQNETNIFNNSNLITTNTNAINSLDARLTTAEADITLLEGEVISLGTEITNINNSIGQPMGLVPLNMAGQIDSQFYNPSVMELKGSWNATTNTPILVDGTGNLGDVYLVEVAGTQFTPSIYFDIGDIAVYIDNKWKRIPSKNNTVVQSGNSTIIVNNTNPLQPIITTQQELTTTSNVNFNSVSLAGPIDNNNKATTKLYVDTAITGVNTNITNIDTRLTTAENDINALELRVDGNETNILNNQVAINNLTTRVDGNETNITVLDGRLTTAENDINALELRVDGNETNITVLDGRLTTAENAINALELRVDANETNILNNQVAINNLTTRVDGNETNITVLDGRLTTAENDINALELRVDANELDITAIDGRLTQAETDIVNLENTDISLQTQITTNTNEINTLKKNGLIPLQYEYNTTVTASNQISISPASLWASATNIRLGYIPNNLFTGIDLKNYFLASVSIAYPLRIYVAIGSTVFYSYKVEIVNTGNATYADLTIKQALGGLGFSSPTNGDIVNVYFEPTNSPADYIPTAGTGTYTTSTNVQLNINEIDNKLVNLNTRTGTAETNIINLQTADITLQTNITNLDNATLKKASNLSDLTNTATARTNLDVYSKLEVDNKDTLLQNQITANDTDILNLQNTDISLQNQINTNASTASTALSNHATGLNQRHTAQHIDNVDTGRTYILGPNVKIALDSADAKLVDLNNTDISLQNQINTNATTSTTALSNHATGLAQRHTASHIDNDNTGRTYLTQTNLDLVNDDIDSRLVNLTTTKLSNIESGDTNTLVILGSGVSRTLTNQVNQNNGMLQFASAGFNAGNGRIPIGNGLTFTTSTITPTANQVLVTNGAGTIQLSTPQNIDTNALVEFARLKLTTSPPFYDTLELTAQDGNIRLNGLNSRMDLYGDNSVIRFTGTNGQLLLEGASADISMTGTGSFITMSGLGSTINLTGDNSVIQNAGLNGVIRTEGANGKILINGSDGIFNMAGIRAFASGGGIRGNVLEECSYMALRHSANTEPTTIEYVDNGSMRITWTSDRQIWEELQVIIPRNKFTAFRHNTDFYKPYFAVRLDGSSWTGSNQLIYFMMGFTTSDALSLITQWGTSDIRLGFELRWEGGANRVEKAIMGRYVSNGTTLLGRWNYGTTDVLGTAEVTPSNLNSSAGDILISYFDRTNMNFYLEWRDSTNAYAVKGRNRILSPDGALLKNNFLQSDLVPIFSLFYKSAGYRFSVLSERQLKTLGITVANGQPIFW